MFLKISDNNFGKVGIAKVNFKLKSVKVTVPVQIESGDMSHAKMEDVREVILLPIVRLAERSS